jgi:hypothetical protein
MSQMQGIPFKKNEFVLMAVAKLIENNHRFEGVYDSGLQYWVLYTFSSDGYLLANEIAFKYDEYHGVRPAIETDSNT